MKNIILLLFLSLQPNLFSQIWKYPYDIMGIENKFNSSYKLPLKYIVTDSSSEQITTTYNEYDRLGNKTKEIYNKLDTIYYVYDKFNDEILRIYSNNDSVFTLIKRRPDDKIIEKKMIRNEKINTTTYEYDDHNNINKVFYNSILYDQLYYDENNRLIKVENYYHDNNKLSEIITYKYHGDTISYEECPYDIKGVRYNWPCETTTGVLNINHDIIYLKSIFYNGTNEPSISTINYSYDEFGKLLNMKINEYGKTQETKCFYDSDGYKLRIEICNDQELIYLVKFIVIEK